MENNQITSKISKQINYSFDVRRLIASFLSNWYWMLLCVAVFVTGAWAYLRYTTPIYAIKSTLLIEERNQIQATVLEKYSGGNNVSNGLFNEMFLLRSQDIVNKVVDSLELNVHYTVQGRVKENEIYEESPIKLLFDTVGYKGGGETNLVVKQIVDGQFEITEGPNKSMRIPYDSWVTKPYGRYKIIYTSGPEVNKTYLKAGIKV